MAATQTPSARLHHANRLGYDAARLGLSVPYSSDLLVGASQIRIAWMLGGLAYRMDQAKAARRRARQPLPYLPRGTAKFEGMTNHVDPNERLARYSGVL